MCGTYQALNIGTGAKTYGGFIIDTKEGHIWCGLRGGPDGRFLSTLGYGGKLSPSEKDYVAEVQGLRQSLSPHLIALTCD